MPPDTQQQSCPMSLAEDFESRFLNALGEGLRIDPEHLSGGWRTVCQAGIESARQSRVLATQQFEILRRDGKMKDALLRADRATAL